VYCVWLEGKLVGLRDLMIPVIDGQVYFLCQVDAL
jgi:hypothetical protein